MLSHGISACDFYYQWWQINKDSWENSSEFSEQAEINRHKDLVAKYNIPESLAENVILYGNDICE